MTIPVATPVSEMPQTLYAGLAELQTRIAFITLRRCLDFDEDGQIDVGPLNAIMIPASADIDAALATPAGVYPKVFLPPFPPKLVELALDGMVYRIGAMFPTVVIIDHVMLMKKVEGDLAKIRTGKMSLGQQPPEPNAVHGGSVHPYPDRGKVPIFSGRKGQWGGIF